MTVASRTAVMISGDGPSTGHAVAEVREPHRWHFFDAEQLCGLHPSVAGNDLFLIVDEEAGTKPAPLKISGDQLVRPFAATPINLRGSRVYQVAVRIEGAEQSRLIGPDARLNSSQRIFIDRK